jgi:hypothetical protein
MQHFLLDMTKIIKIAAVWICHTITRQAPLWRTTWSYNTEKKILKNVLIYVVIYLYLQQWMFVCVCVSRHNSGTPGAISTKLGTLIAIYIYIYICKNIMYVLYIFRREVGVGGREFGSFTLLRKSNYCCC